MHKNPYAIFGLLVLFGIADLIIWGFRVDLTKSDWASWVQAIGSIAAIGVAIFVSQLQHKNDLSRDEKNDRESLKRMLQSIHDEIEVVDEGFDATVGGALAKLRDDQYFKSKIYIAARPFPVYRAYVANIGNIRDRVLRKEIIATHTRFARLVLMIDSHNDQLIIFQEKIAAAIRMHQPDKQYAIVAAEKELCSHSIKLRDQYLALKQGVIVLLGSLKAAVDAIK